MIHRYCQDHHHTTHELCPDCQELLAYARQRLRHCPFQEHKTTCGKCPIHCYAPGKRERIRAVMRYAGPRMLFTHPLLALLHLLDGLRKPRHKADSPPA
jgi:predicted amidophosphoribosyltransferase